MADPIYVTGEAGAPDFGLLTARPQAGPASFGRVYVATDVPAGTNVYICAKTSNTAYAWAQLTLQSEIAVVFTPIKTVADNGYAIQINQYVGCDPSGGPFGMTLPDATILPVGQCCIVQGNASVNAITVTPLIGGQLINGAASFVLNAGSFQKIVFTRDGTGWRA